MIKTIFAFFPPYPSVLIHIAAMQNEAFPKFTSYFKKDTSNVCEDLISAKVLTSSDNIDDRVRMVFAFMFYHDSGETECITQVHVLDKCIPADASMNYNHQGTSAASTHFADICCTFLQAQDDSTPPSYEVYTAALMRVLPENVINSPVGQELGLISSDDYDKYVNAAVESIN